MRFSLSILRPLRLCLNTALPSLIRVFIVLGDSKLHSRGKKKTSVSNSWSAGFEVYKWYVLSHVAGQNKLSPCYCWTAFLFFHRSLILEYFLWNFCSSAPWRTSAFYWNCISVSKRPRRSDEILCSWRPGSSWLWKRKPGAVDCLVKQVMSCDGASMFMFRGRLWLFFISTNTLELDQQKAEKWLTFSIQVCFSQMSAWCNHLLLLGKQECS